MTEAAIFGLAFAFAAGLVLGAAWSAMLWLLVRRIADARHPLLWLAGGAIVRIALVIGGFYWVMAGSWQRLLACLAGFLVARLAAQLWLRAGGDAVRGM